MSMREPGDNTAGAKQSRLVIAGGSGYLGCFLARFFSARGADVVLLSRTLPPAGTPGRHERWDARTLGPWARALDGASALVNLAGRSVDCVKTPDHCDEILRSRVEATLVLGKAIRAIDHPPPVWVQMSTAHAYGDPPEAICDEDSPFGVGLAPAVAGAWEEAHARSLLQDTRSVILRTSFVLGLMGGALPRLARLCRAGLGGTIGHGRQGISWIHEQDFARLVERAIANDRMHGAYVISAPNPVSNREFMRALRRVAGGLGSRRGAWPGVGLPAPACLVRLGAPLLMRTDPELALYGRYVVSKRLSEEGFDFAFAGLDSAMTDLFVRTL